MVKNFYLENFKTFAQPTNIKIDDLLVVAGSNSGGKSTIIQALLLLAQTLENVRSDVALDLGGKYIQFAEFNEIVYGRPTSPDNGFSIGFEVESYEPDFFSGELFYEAILRKRISIRRNPNSDKKNNLTHIDITFASSNSRAIYIQKTNYKKQINGFGKVILSVIREKGAKYRSTINFIPDPDLPKIFAKDILNKFEKTFDEIENFPKSKYVNFLGSDRAINDPFYLLGFKVNQIPEIGQEIDKILKSSLEKRIDSESTINLFTDLLRFAFQSRLEYSTFGKVPFDHFFVSKYFRTSGIVESESYQYADFVEILFGHALRDIRRFLRGIKYIGPLRAKPERAYLAIGSPIDIGNAGENAISILWLHQNDKVKNKTSIGGKPTERKLVVAVQDWLQEFGIAYSFHITKPKRVIYQAELESAPGSNTMVTIADVGFGVSQLLPVIVASLRASEGSTIILEQPEIHLHPRLQGNLADFLICMVELGKNVVVETHSEHLINMLRLRIVQDKSGELQKRVGIIFVRNSQHKRSGQTGSKDSHNTGSYIEHLKVDEYGKIINWPTDFFPESTNLNEEILKAMMDKFSNEG